MADAKNILVGIDLAAGDRLVSSKLTEASEAAVDQAVQLAVGNKAKLTFQAVIDLPPNTMAFLDEDPHSLDALKAQASLALSRLEQTAKDRGVPEVHSQFCFGQSWIELVRQVITGQHDLLMVGTRGLHGIERMILGSTGLKLFRNCPCPVWITKPHPTHRVPRVLVAVDLQPISERILVLGTQVARALNGELHLLHALEYPFDNTSGESAPNQDAYRVRVKSDAHAKIATLLDHSEVSKMATPPHVHIVEGLAEDVILDTIKKLEIDVLVMATIAHSGLMGLLVGNTAERLMTQIPCSVVAIKPADFKCPISV